MIFRLLAFLLFTVFILTPVTAAEHNTELQQLFEADQNARRDLDVGWDEIDALDEANRAEVFSMLAKGEIKTGLDYFYAAVIMQHSESVEHIRLAHFFATISAQLGYERAKWMQAASWDRLLMYFEQPQWYGTQFSTNDQGEWRLHEVQEGAVTDEQRAEWRVPSLEESRNRAIERNRN
ncbi:MULTISPECIES: hypothetical protein [Gammaproteobacteria]|uniref:hypothetical protein n=1 Tax=Gammaproteobacteria TaxID=1236 RepID=UPI000DD06893|nr:MULTISPECIES: hypothetical protein [Gammaproteobacteria]RTE87680.1 hypothetical protein DQX04_04745 [Aliidiomarina sp. B3213]TCZ92536.1 hypothetical protein EYQ95_00550 [Lysobacter sp. N42]